MFYVNDILEFTSDRTRYRIINIDFPTDSAWLFPLFEKNPMPTLFSIFKLESLLTVGKELVVLSGEQFIKAKISESEARARDITYSNIKPLVEAQGIFIPSERNRLINQRAVELKCSARTLIRALRLYWHGGQTRNALVPKFHSRGSCKGTTSGRGRPPKYRDGDIYQLSSEDLEIFKQIIEQRFLKSKTATIKGTYNLMLRENYSVVDSEGNLRPRAPGEFPSVPQFRRFFKNNYSHETVIRSRDGDAEFELNHNAKLGDAELSVFTVGDSFEIDATITDLFSVSSVDRNDIVGKPTCYLIFDSKSWLIPGLYVGFEQPSWPAALQAIVSIAEDKKALCERHGITYRPEDWPADGILPKEFIADRGEMLARESTRISDALETTVMNLPSRMALRKPHVECGFHLIQSPMAEHVPGYEPPANFRKRQGKRYDKDACLTLHEIIGIFLRAIIRFNNTPRPDYPLTPSQILAGLIPTPCNLWNHEIRTRAGSLPRYTSEFLRLALLPKAKASVTSEGIRFRNCYYTCDEAVKRGWFVRARQIAFEVTIIFDRRLVDSIYIQDDSNPSNVFSANLLEKSVSFAGMSFQEVESIIFKRKKIRQAGLYETINQDFEFHSAVDPIISTAFAEMKKQSKGKSRSSRRSDIRETRAEELTIERKEKALLVKPKSEAATAEVMNLSPTQTSIQQQESEKSKRNARLMEMLNGN